MDFGSECPQPVLEIVPAGNHAIGSEILQCPNAVCCCRCQGRGTPKHRDGAHPYTRGHTTDGDIFFPTRAGLSFRLLRLAVDGWKLAVSEQGFCATRCSAYGCAAKCSLGSQPCFSQKAKMPGNAAHHRCVTLGDPEPPCAVVHFPHRLWWRAPSRLHSDGNDCV